MRRNHYIAICVASVIMWIGVLNYLFIRKMNIEQSDSKASVDKLEQDVNQELQKSNILINNLKSFLYYYNKSEDKFVNDKQNQLGNEEDKFDKKNNALDKVESKYTNEDQSGIPHADSYIAVLVFACNRVTVSRCLDKLIKYRPSKNRFPIIVSQDCAHESTAETIKSYGNEVYHIRQPDQRDISVPPREKKFKGYFKIARHYGWALNQTFINFNFDTVIVVEDDLDISPDFYEYFSATLPILKSDPTLWCVSAWNDNGLPDLIDINASDLLYRTDFFPGLGWMLIKSLWIELMTKWPRSYWDDWIREPEQRKGRSCIRPELPRTKTFGKIGVSNGLFYEKHLKYIHLNEKFVQFSKQNLTYLSKNNYDSSFISIVYNTPVVSRQELKFGTVSVKGAVRVEYTSKGSFKQSCKSLGLMDDFKSGVPRTAYQGIVSFMYKNRRVFLAPDLNWNGYNVTW